jgi:ribosome-binding protein aMBF1 (putative translation factor)
MVNKIEAEISAMQADFAGRMAWLRSNYLPDPLPKVVKDSLVKFEASFDVLRGMAEDQEATAAYLRVRDQEAIPDAVVGRLLDGENPVRVWREYRGLSLRSLAEQAGISPSALSDTETGKSEGRPATLPRIADILGVSLDDLVPTVGTGKTSDA